jgi:hypothetical protein
MELDHALEGRWQIGVTGLCSFNNKPWEILTSSIAVSERVMKSDAEGSSTAQDGRVITLNSDAGKRGHRYM